MNTRKRSTLGPILLAITGLIAAGCEAKDEASPPGDVVESAELEALPTVEEAEQNAAELIDDENADEALRELEAELDSEGE